MASTITFQFWASNDGTDWSGPYSAITEVPDSKYIKVRANLSGDASKVPVLKDMEVDYFKKKEDIWGNWASLSHTKIDATKETKTWTTKADLEGGALTNVWVPEGLNRLELKRLALSGTATYIYDAGLGKVVNWVSFNSSKPNANIYYRDDFRDNSIAAWTIVGGTWVGINEYMRGTGAISWQTNRVRIGPTTWEGLDILFKGYLPDAGLAHIIYLRPDAQGYNVNSYGWTTSPPYTSRIRVGGGEVLEDTQLLDYGCPAGAWYWIRAQIYTEGGDVKARIKWWLPGQGEPGWKVSTTWPGIWRASGCFSLGRHTSAVIGYYDNVLISRKEGIPSPANCSVSFQLATSDNGTDWSAWTDDIMNCADSRYIKVKAAFSRTSLLSAMPTLEDATIGYFLKGS